MSSGYHQENRKVNRNLYDKLSQETTYGCQGSCSCAPGTRTEFDVQQYQRATYGQMPDYPVGIVPGWPV